MLDPKFLGEYAQMLFQLKNGEAYKMGELKDFGQVGARALDDHTLLIELRGPTPYFLSMLKHHAWFPVHPGTVDSTGAYFDLSGRWTRPSTFIGNGPFVLKEWKDYQWIYVEKSPTYWDSGRVRLKGIYFFPIEDNNTEMRMFRSGQLHMTNTVPTNDLPIMREQGDPRLRLEPAISTYFYFFNTTRPPLDNVLVRRALSLAIDRQTIVDKVTLGGQKPAGSMVPPEFEDYQPPDNAVSFNPEEARRLLAEAGYPNGEGFPRVELLFNTSEGHRKIAEAIVEMWAKHLNIKPVLDNTEWKVFLDRQSHLDYDVSRSGWLGDYLDPLTFLELFRTGNGNNDSGWSNPRYDALIEAAFVAPSPDEHYRLMREAEAILVEDMPIAPVYFYTRAYMLDPRVQNWNPAPMEYRPWKYIWLDPEASVGKAE
jgi:oligopeptide transport system substrate-binding protein